MSSKQANKYNTFPWTRTPCYSSVLTDYQPRRWPRSKRSIDHGPQIPGAPDFLQPSSPLPVFCSPGPTKHDRSVRLLDPQPRAPGNHDVILLSCCAAILLFRLVPAWDTGRAAVRVPPPPDRLPVICPSRRVGDPASGSPRHKSAVRSVHKLQSSPISDQVRLPTSTMSWISLIRNKDRFSCY